MVKTAWVLALFLCGQGAHAQSNALVNPAGGASGAGFRPFSTVGMAVTVGIGGIGFDVATPLSRKFNLRAGAQNFGYSTTFVEQGANIDAHLRLQSAHASLDWFPFHRGFRVSPLLVFANDNRGQATAIIPAGESLSLNGENFVSSATDPLRGAGSVDFRKAAPGLSAGWGNVIPRSRGHFSFPWKQAFTTWASPG